MPKRAWHCVFLLSFSLSAALGQPVPVPVVEPPPEPQASTAPVQGPADRAELETFVDGVMAAHLQAHDIAGATVSVVKDGQLFFAKGYGYADVEAKKEVDPAYTLFRIGSVSKLFTWTAVMQLVEQGKLDLDADVNTYLTDFKIPGDYPEPITLKHLMTHTPGFEDQVIGLFARSLDRLRPLAEILAEELPARVRPPGRLSSYSNHGTGIAGYIVERTSEKTFDEYVEDLILGPLQMQQTTFRQPLPEELSEDMSKGYTYQDGRFKEEDFELVPLAPAGSASASATDMGRFMIAHLQGGAYEDARILSEEATAEMHGLLFRHAEGIPGWLHGFYEMDRNGQRIFGHGGDTIYFHTQLALFPEHQLGLFVSYNSAKGPAARGEFLNAFIDRYFPVPPLDLPEPEADFETRVQRLLGTYRTLRYSHRSPAKLALLVAALQVSTEDGLLRLDPMAGDPTRFAEIAPLEFQQVDGTTRLVFRDNDQGEVTHLFPSNFPIALEKVPAWQTPVFHLAVLGTCSILFLSAFFLWPIGAWLRWRWDVEGARFPAGIATLTAWVLSTTFLLFAAGLVVALKDPNEIVFGIPRVMEMSLWLPLIGAVLCLFGLVWVVFAWKNGYWGVFKRLHFSLVVLAGLVFVWWLDYWNLLGFRY